MKTIYNSIAILIITLALYSCASYTPYAYNDTYYSPNNDPVNKVQKDPREDFNKTNNIQYDGSYSNRYVEEEKSDNYPQSLYNNRYAEAERNENSQINTQAIPAEEQEYYDEEYAQTLQQIGSPVRSFNTYDPYQRDRILYTQDPFFFTPTVYGNNIFWDPFVPRTGLNVGWNSWNGWNVGVGVGLGLGFGFPNGGFGYCAPVFNPWNPYRNFGWNRWNDPFFNPYNNWGGFNNNLYLNGYNQGFINGYNNGNQGVSDGNNSNQRYYNTPRGDKGSNSYINNDGRPNRPNSATNSINNKTAVPANNQSGRPTRPTSTKSNSSQPNTKKSTPTEQRITRPTPLKYQTEKTINNYGNPQLNQQSISPNTVTKPVYTAPRQATQPRPNYNGRPRQNGYNNQQERVQPAQPQRTQPQRAQPQQQSQPTINRSRPSYNRSSPSYSPPSNSSGGNRSTPSRSVPSRPSRPR